MKYFFPLILSFLFFTSSCFSQVSWYIGKSRSYILEKYSDAKIKSSSPESIDFEFSPTTDVRYHFDSYGLCKFVLITIQNDETSKNAILEMLKENCTMSFDKDTNSGVYTCQNEYVYMKDMSAMGFFSFYISSEPPRD
ncbi:hypothetical protein LBMAG27_16050 [Bacteroidota bacterium]|nr:hypothetical protein LBMAG27_16050 [Bacteroidota bacterium]